MSDSTELVEGQSNDPRSRILFLLYLRHRIYASLR